MKFATLRDGSPILVSKDLKWGTSLGLQCASLVEVLQRWNEVKQPLQHQYEALSFGTHPNRFEFNPLNVLSPVPKPAQWLDASTFENHGRLMEKAFNLPPADYTVNPLMYQGNADDVIAPTDDAHLPSEADGMDFEGEIGVVLDDTPMGTDPAEALAHIKLLVLINDISLRQHAAREMRTGFGWIQAKPCTAFAPVAVTVDELGEHWANARVTLPLRCERNAEWFGHPDGSQMSFGFDRLVSYAAYSRPLRAGTIIGSGTFSNSDRSMGSACIAERRAIESIDFGEMRTPFMRSGERVRLEMKDPHGQSLFGAVDQRYLTANSTR